MLNVSMNDDNGELKVNLEGRLDASVAQNFEKQLEDALEGKKSVTFDFASLEYISSAGLRVILWAQQYMEEKGNGNVVIKNASDLIKEIFDDTGFTDIVELE